MEGALREPASAEGRITIVPVWLWRPSRQGYADRQLPQQPIQRIAALVAAPPALASSLQSSIVQEAKKRGILAEDAFHLLPPTRTYSDAEVKVELARDGINAVLLLTVGDTGVQKEYAGTVFFGNSVTSMNTTGTATSFGNVTNVSLNGMANTTSTATATPTYHYSRRTAFQARLVEASSGRTLWVGSGQVQAGGLLFVGNGASAYSTATAIFNGLQSKGLISPAALFKNQDFHDRNKLSSCVKNATRARPLTG
jgi:hypothetical protein